MAVPGAGFGLTLDADLPQVVSPGSQGELVMTTHSQPVGAGSTASALLIASLDSACLLAAPPGDSLQLAQAGQAQTWSWRLEAPESAEPCPVALRLSARPLNGGDDQLLFVKSFDVRSVLVLGLPARVAQIAGFLGLACGLLGLGALELRGRLAGHRQPV